jgi:predicted secreted protein
MASLSGNDGQIQLATTTGGTYYPVAAVRNFSIDITADKIETTTMGTDVRTYVQGLSSYNGSADVYFDPTNFNGNVYFNPTSGTVGQGNYAGKFYINQDAVNDVMFYANSMVITGYSIKSSMDGMVEASISFQGSGETTFSGVGNK